jgi:hypothetical protein
LPSKTGCDRNSLENGKSHFSPSRPIRPSPSCACARARVPSVPNRRTPPVGSNPPAPSLPLSLSLLCGADLSVPFLFARAHLLSLPREPHPSAVPNLPPTSPPWKCPHPRVLRPPPHALAPLEPAPRSPTSPYSFAPSAEHSRPLSRPARATRQLCRRSPKPAAVPRSPLSPRHVRCVGEFHITVSNSGHPLVRLLPLWLARSALTGVFARAVGVRLRRPEGSPPPRRLPGAPGFALVVSNLPMHLIHSLLP